MLGAIAADGSPVTAAAVAAVSMPTLVVGAGRDVVHPLTMARALATSIPTADFTEITPKSVAAERYRVELRQRLAAFLAANASEEEIWRRPHLPGNKVRFR